MNILKDYIAPISSESIEDVGYSLPQGLRIQLLETLLWYEQQYRSMKHPNNRIHRYAEHVQLEPDAGKKAREVLCVLMVQGRRNKELEDLLLWLYQNGAALKHYDRHIYGIGHSEAEELIEKDGGDRILQMLSRVCV